MQIFVVDGITYLGEMDSDGKTINKAMVGQEELVESSLARYVMAEFLGELTVVSLKEGIAFTSQDLSTVHIEQLKILRSKMEEAKRITLPVLIIQTFKQMG